MRRRKGPWIVTGTKVIYQNPWLKVREDKVIRPDGKGGVFGVVSIMPGVSVLPLDNEGNVYLTKEYHYAVAKITIEAISGGINKGETRIQAAKRELKEESGLIAKKWIYFGIVDPFTNVLFAHNYLYLAQELTQSQAKPEDTEIIEIIKVPLKKAVKWVMESKITHSATAVLILKVRDYFK